MVDDFSEYQLPSYANSVFFNLSSDLMCVTCTSGIFSHVNRQWEEYLGYHHNQLVGSELFALVHPDDVLIVNALYQACLLQSLESFQVSTSSITNFRFRLCRSDRCYLWIDWSAIRNSDEDSICLVGRDVTNELRRESYLSKLMDITQVGFWEIDLDTEELYWSDNVHVIHETDSATYKPSLTDAMHFYHPDSLPVLSAAVNRQLTSGEPYDLELKFITSKGNHRWVRAVSQTEIQENKVIRSYGTFEDITGKVARRAEHEKLKRRIDLALRTSNIGVWDLDVTNIGKKELEWDEQMYRLYDISKADFHGYTTWESLLHPEDRPFIERAIADTISHKKDLSSCFRIITRSGDVRYLEAIATLACNQASGEVHILGVNWDVTEQEHIKAELLEKKILAEKSDVAKSTFIANMSHELRTPLNSVIGFSARLIKNTDKYDERTKSSLLAINRNGHHLLSLVNDILDLSKLDAGHLSLKYTSTSSAFFFHSIFEEFRSQIEEKGLAYRIHVQGDVSIKVDELRIKQVFLNLISNAIKFTSSGYINVNIIHDHNLMISIEDSGVGIRKEDLSRVFKRFEQFDEDSRFNVGYGTGLGLAISQEIVRMHGGSIRLVSEYTKGSCFTVVLPF